MSANMVIVRAKKDEEENADAVAEVGESDEEDDVDPGRHWVWFVNDSSTNTTLFLL
jgi:hypothetical protein